MSIQQQFGARVRKLRKEHKNSQEEFAFLCNVHRTYMGCIERGEKNLTIKNIHKIAKALKISISTLFNGIE
jgi:transcriptional regulator with XRE-family HTH domain